MAWIIYKHTLILDCPHKGWSYIGLTKQNLSHRTGKGSGYSEATQAVFSAAINKYGWDNFSHTVIEGNILTLEEANNRERYWIAYYHTWIHDQQCQGYNMTAGGDCSVQNNYTTVMKGPEHKKILVSELDDYITEGWHKTKRNEKWNLEHPNYMKQYNKEYKQAHKQQHYERNKKYNEAHKEEIALYMKKYREEHKEQQKAYMKKYHNEHKDKRDRREYQRQYYQKHKKDE